VLWIRILIRKDPHHFGHLNPHQIKIWIRIKVYKLNPDPYQFAAVKPKCMEYEPILAPFQAFFVKLGSGSGSGPLQGDKSDPDPHQIKKLFRTRNRIRVISRIRIRIKVIQIHNTAGYTSFEDL
jgi:hypothetical protein